MIWYRDRYEVLQHAAAIAPAKGMILEFGVATGGTIRCLSNSVSLLDRMIYGFDSFEGLPEKWSGYPAGHFACLAPEVPNNVQLEIGLFSETLAPFLFKHPDNVALVHIDCDLYSSTRLVLHHLTPRIVPGTVIVLDEYWIVVDQEQRAFKEWLQSTGIDVYQEARSIEQLCVVVR